MVYLALKALHIVAVILWIGSLTVLTLVSSKNGLTPAQLKTATRLTEFSIGVTWLAGIALVIMAGWYSATWWQIKIVLVIGISAIHSIAHRRWKRLSENDEQELQWMPPALMGLTLIIVFLAVFKQPF